MYVLNSLPHGFKFELLTLEQAKENFRVFVSRIPERLRVLEALVRIELPRWTADLSDASLGHLGDWFARHVEERPVTDQEREALRKELGVLKDLAENHRECTLLTLSLGLDIGIYIGECVRMRSPATSWKLCRRSKAPVVSGPGILERLARVNEQNDYYALGAVSLVHGVLRAQRKAAQEGQPVREPTTNAQKFMAAELSIPNQDPNTMLQEFMHRAFDPGYDRRRW